MLNRNRVLALILCSALAVSMMSGCNVNINANKDNDAKSEEEVKEEVPAEEPAEESEEVAEEPEQVILPELKSVDFDLTVYDDDNKYKVFESHGNSYLCTDESAKVYPELSDVLKGIDQNEKDGYQYTIDQNLEDAKEMAAEQQKEGNDYTYFCYSETELKCADERVVSLLRTEYGYLGGAHPDYYYQTFNLFSKTGKDLTLADIITDKDKLKTILTDKLNEEYPDGNFFDLDESLGNYVLELDPDDPDKYTYNFTIDPAGVSFYFGPYDLNSYADGDQKIDLFYDEISDILKDGFVYSDYEEEGRGDVIDDDEAAAEDEIRSKNTLVIKAPGYTGLTSIKNENNDDGTYFYEDMTSDGMTDIINMSYANSQRDGQAPDAYAENFVCALVDNDAKISGSKQDDKLTGALTYPAYRVEWESGSNEDSKQAIGVVILTDNFTYFYGFKCPLDSFEDNEEFYNSELESIELIELN